MRPQIRRSLVVPLTLLIAMAMAFPAAAQGSGRSDRPDRPEQSQSQAGSRNGAAPVINADHPDAIDGQYIVVFEKNARAQDVRSAQAESRNNGARVHHTYSSALNGFSATLNDRALRNLQRNPNVAYIEADMEVTITNSQSPATWGLDRIDQRNLPLNNTYNYDRTGAGVRSYIIDTGIRRTHQQFGNRAVHGFTAINDGRGSNDCNGHGTHVAGTVGASVHGVAKATTLVAVRVLNCQGSGTNSGVIAGVDWVTNNHSKPAVANMSLGGGISTALDNAVANSVAAGVTYAVAAGNSNANACNYSPARVASALTVGSTASNDSRSSFSNWGGCVDIFAPGTSITAPWHTSNTATNTISGTSMASPHVAGVAALYLEANPTATPAAVGNAITSTATSGVLSGVGSGSPNLLVYSLLDGNGGGPGDPGDPDPAPCSYTESYSGSLSGTGAEQFQPNGNYFYSPSGTHRGCLIGPAGADFDLYLWRWNGWTWQVVAQGISPDSVEDVTYTGPAGYYVWRIHSYSGSGSYDFSMTRP